RKKRASKPTVSPSLTLITPITETATPSTVSKDRFYLEIAWGGDLPTQNWQPTYNLGGGGKICAGYKLSPNLAIQLDMEKYNFSGTNFSGAIFDTDVRFLPTLRYQFPLKGIS